MAVDSLDQFSPILPHGGDADDPVDPLADPPADPPADPNPADEPPNPPDDDADASLDDDDAAPDDDSTDDSPRNAQDSLDDGSPQGSIAAAAVQAASRAQSARRSAGVADVSLQIAAAHQRDVLETKISELVDGINDQIESAERDGGRGIGVSSTDEELARRKLELISVIMTKASIVMLIITAFITIYLTTLWTSLPAVVRCLVVVTLAWLSGAIMTIILQYSAGGEEGEADDASSARGQSSAAAAEEEPWQNKMTKSALIISLLLLLVSVVSYNTMQQHPCSAQFMAVDVHCDDDRNDMHECFSTCVAGRGTPNDASDLIEPPPCPGLADALCKCTERCASPASSDACDEAMIARLECSLANEHKCGGYACPKSSFETNMRMGAAKDVAARLRNAGTGEEKDATWANGGLGAAKDVAARTHKVGMRNEKGTTSATRGLVARAAGISTKLRKVNT